MDSNLTSEQVPTSTDRRWLFAIIVLAMVAIDQSIKHWVGTHLVQGQSLAWPWTGVFELEYTRNQGIAFGMAQGKGWLFTPIALLISIGAGLYSWKHPRDSAWLHTAMALLVAGAVGNLYDRISLGYVRDMFRTRFMEFPVFNWADTCITFATVILILVWTKEAIDARSHSPGAAPAVSDE